MADENQLKILKRGVAAWSEWRRKEVEINLRGANLSIAADLTGAHLTGADLGVAMGAIPVPLALEWRDSG
jgi:hypothetical protein